MDYVDIIKKITLFHCARGPKRCEKCRELEKEGEKFCLIRVYLKAGNIARPMTEIVYNGKKILCEYDVEKVFKNVIKAKKYAKNNGINIIIS